MLPTWCAQKRENDEKKGCESVLQKGTKKLNENEDSELRDSTLQIGRLFGRNGVSEIFTVRALNWRSDDKPEKQAKKDYYEVCDSVLKTANKEFQIVAYMIHRNTPLENGE